MTITELIAALEAVRAEHGELEAVMHDREWGEYWTISHVTAEGVMGTGDGTTYKPCKGKKPPKRVLLLDA